MLVIFAIVLGVLFGGGVSLVLRRDLIAVAFGLGLIGTAVNVLLLVAGRVRHMRPPVLDDGVGGAAVGNPLPQAFVLTAIVIGFGVLTLVFALARRSADDPAGAESSNDQESVIS